MTDRIPPRGTITDRATADAVARRYASGELPLPRRREADENGIIIPEDGIRDDQDRYEAIIQRILRDDTRPNE